MVESYQRRITCEVTVGEVGIGADNPVRVQSMITAQTQDIENVFVQIQKLHQAKAEIVRITTPTLKDAQALAEIKVKLKNQYQDVPLVADVHHQGTNIAVEATRHVEKVRINPGLLAFHKRVDRADNYESWEIEEQISEINNALVPIIEACKKEGAALRVGVNHGSLSERMLVTYGDTPQGMVESAMEFIKICEANNFRNLVISLKASRVPIMVESNRLMVDVMKKNNMEYPVHLGVTEAGRGETARIKSAVGIGALLVMGIGDTIRVSLTEDPTREIPVAYNILQATGARRTSVDFIACPSCGRTKFDIEEHQKKIEEHFGQLAGDISIANIGCVVNGVGEMGDAKYGIIGKAAGVVTIYRGKTPIKNVTLADSISELETLIKEDGNWIEPTTFPTPELA